MLRLSELVAHCRVLAARFARAVEHLAPSRVLPVHDVHMRHPLGSNVSRMRRSNMQGAMRKAALMATAGLALSGSAPAPAARAAEEPAKPRVTVTVPDEQHLLRTDGAVAFVRCDRPCRVRAGGTLTIGERSFELEKVGARAGRRTVRIVLPLTPEAERALRAARADDRRTEVALRVRVRAFPARTAA